VLQEKTEGNIKTKARGSKSFFIIFFLNDSINAPDSFHQNNNLIFIGNLFYMISKAKTAEQYIKELPADRKQAFTALRSVILKNLPKGFEETMGYGMIGYVVPHSLYPAGYHCDPTKPLPFMGIASQKNFIAFYHMGVYADPKLMKWVTAEYSKFVNGKVDMGKSCFRFKKPEQIPLKLIGELTKKVSMKDWIDTYEKVLKK